jgi:hypothetical protein
MSESTYKPEYAEIAQQLLAEGKSKNGVCANLGICKQTLYNWEKEFPDFKRALSVGVVASEYHWEEMGADGIIADGFNTAMYVIQMRNRFGWKATDPKEKADAEDLTQQAQVMAIALNMINDKKKEVEGMQ